MNIYHKDNIIFYLLVIAFLIIIYFIINSFNYFDLANLCYIRTERDVVRGNEKTIKEALKYIKKNKKSDYKTVCRYVDTISEKYCIIADGHIDRGLLMEGYDLPGCYVKGSKNIYLKPEWEESEEIIKKRAEAIIKYSNFSREFWENK